MAQFTTHGLDRHVKLQALKDKSYEEILDQIEKLEGAIRLKNTPEEFLKQLNPHSKVFDLSVDYEFTEEQLLLFAKLYHENELKMLQE